MKNATGADVSPPVRGDREEALRVIGTMAICEEGETAEQRGLIVDACRDVALQALSTPVSAECSIFADQYADYSEACDKVRREMRTFILERHASVRNLGDVRWLATEDG